MSDVNRSRTAGMEQGAVPGIQHPGDVPRPDEPLADLLRTATSDLSTLFHQELELAKVEIKQDARQAGKIGGMFGAAAVTGHLALLFLSFALAWLLDQAMPRALAFLIVGVLYGIVAAVLFLRGRDEAKRFNPKPEQTMETLKEDVQWAKRSS
jgi:hypothetical protein